MVEGYPALIARNQKYRNCSLMVEHHIIWNCRKPFGPGMPDECLPDPGKTRGRLSYTTTNEASGAKVEVLLKARAFRIVRLAILSTTGGLVFNIL